LSSTYVDCNYGDSFHRSRRTHPITANDLSHWGDQCKQKHKKHTRIYFQNINGIQTKSYHKWFTSLEWLRDNGVDICGFAETNINTSDPRTIASYSNKVSTFGHRSMILFLPNTSPSDSKYQPGGSALLCVEQWKSRIVHKFVDNRKWGRYVGTIFRLNKSKTLLVISAYRCIQKSGNTAGHKTTVRHQREGIDKLNRSITVRKLCFEDITGEIQKNKITYGQSMDIIVMLDANESIHEFKSQIPDFLLQNDLMEPLT
jgi:hypothetical protein